MPGFCARWEWIMAWEFNSWELNGWERDSWEWDSDSGGHGRGRMQLGRRALLGEGTAL
jgi:hypothetical protein